MSTNTNTVHEIYAAFRRGDVTAILAKLDENVEWEYGTAAHEVPWLMPRRGRKGAGEFFESLAGVEFQNFVPKTILADKQLVVAIVDIAFTVKKNGKKVVEQDEAHIWRFNDAGQVVRFRHCADTNQHVHAYRG